MTALWFFGNRPAEPWEWDDLGSGAAIGPGRQEHGQGQFFCNFDLDDVVPPDHLVRMIDGFLDLGWVHAELAPYDAHTGRRSIRS